MGSTKVLIIFLAFWTSASCLNFNITNFSNCVDVPLNYQNDAEIEVKDITYERNQLGFIDVVHGKYVVHFLRDHQMTELIINTFQCTPESTGICGDNSKDYLIALSCERFLSDKSGPWYMFRNAVDKRNSCAESVGEWELNGAKIESEYFKDYINIEEGRFRMRFIYHLPNEAMDAKFLRGCIEMDFDILP